jgi:hypothetical protein
MNLLTVIFIIFDDSAIDGSFILEFSAIVTAIFSFDVINTEIRLSNLRMNLYKTRVWQTFL